MLDIVEPELTTVPGRDHHAPPLARTRQEQRLEVGMAADQPGKLVTIEEMIYQAGEAKGREPKMVIPELGIGINGRRSGMQTGKVTFAGKYHCGIAAL